MYDKQAQRTREEEKELQCFKFLVYYVKWDDII